MTTQTNLTTLANVKAYLGSNTTTDDAQITRMIGAVSAFVYAYCARPFFYKRQVTEFYDGQQNTRIVLKRWPVLSVDALTIDGQSVPAVALPYLPSASGYFVRPPELEPPGNPQDLNVNGYQFNRGVLNVGVTYTAGYCVSKEAATIPTTPFKITAQQPYGSFMGDEGVTFTATGAALTQVTTAPSAGQYSVDAFGAYTFAAADVGKGVYLNYSYVPADVENACIEMIAEVYKSKDRIGVNSKSLGGQETISFTTQSMNKRVAASLEPYRRVTF